MSELLQHTDKIHTTIMGEERIRRNLKLEVPDIVGWCKKTVMHADKIIMRGKNWYVYFQDNIITINKKSFTVITAHKLNAKICDMIKNDYQCLEEFLYLSIFIPEGQALPPRELIFEPSVYLYIKDFGKHAGDCGVTAKQNDQIIGAAWARIIPAGHLDDSTPELAISVLPNYRGFGIGTKLMYALFKRLKDNGFSKTSLSVQKDNPAVRFYKRLGYQIITERLDGAGHEDYIMLKNLD